jgi:Tol biopolymer transport system component
MLIRAMNASPRWLADGRVVFTSIRDTLRLSADAETANPRPFVGASEIYVVNSDGTAEQRVTDFNLRAGSYPGAFRPAEACRAPGFCFAGYISLTPMAAARRTNTVAVGVVEIRFSECCSYTDLLRFADGLARLEQATTLIPGVRREGIRSIDWSGNDQRLLTAVDSDADMNVPNNELWLYDAADHRVVGKSSQAQDSGSFTSAALSPDGTQAVYCTLRGSGPESSWAIMAVRLPGGEPRVVKELPIRAPATAGVSVFTDEAACLPRWSGDGSYVVVGAATEQIWFVEVATGRTFVVARGSQPDWQVSSVDPSK